MRYGFFLELGSKGTQISHKIQITLLTCFEIFVDLVCYFVVVLFINCTGNYLPTAKQKYVCALCKQAQTEQQMY